MRYRNDLGKDNIFILMLRLTIPSMLAQFINVLYSITDRIFISKIPVIGNLALAGIGVCAPIITFITSFCFLVGLGGAPLVAIKLGEKNLEEAQNIMANSFIGLIFVSVLTTLFFLIVKVPMLRLFGASENIIGYADTYLTIYLTGTIFAMLSLGLNAFIYCQGFSRIAMISILIGAILNIALDWIFILVFNLGVKGAAWATVISQAVSCIWVILFLISKKSYIKLSVKGFNFKTIGKIMALGLSPFIIMMTDSVIIIALNAIIQKAGGINGDIYIAGATIVVSFMQIITAPLGGITSGAQSVMSYNYGAMNFDRIKKAFRYLLLFCFIFTSVMFILSMTIPEIFVKIFTNDEEISKVAVKGIKVYTFGIVFLTTQYACVDTLTAFGCAKHALSLSMFRKLVLMLPLTFILPEIFGVESVFYAEPIADILSGIVSAIVFYITLNKIFKKREESMKLSIDN